MDVVADSLSDAAASENLVERFRNRSRSEEKTSSVMSVVRQMTLQYLIHDFNPKDVLGSFAAVESRLNDDVPADVAQPFEIVATSILCSRRDVVEEYVRRTSEVFDEWVENGLDGEIPLPRFPKRLRRDATTDALKNYVEDVLETECVEDRSEGTLGIVVERVEAVSNALGLLRGSSAKALACERFVRRRVSELFDAVAEFPDSTSFFEDLRSCVAVTPTLLDVVRDALVDQLERRLLHPGAATHSILIVYLRLVKSTKVLDQNGILLEAVGENVKAYLRKRPETVRCVVTALTASGRVDEERRDDDAFELLNELGLIEHHRLSALQPIDFDLDGVDEVELSSVPTFTASTSTSTSIAIEVNDYFRDQENQVNENVVDDAAKRDVVADDDGDGNDSFAFSKWIPERMEVDVAKSSKSRKTNDVLAKLVHVYGSKDLFVDEYKKLLSSQLVESPTFETDAQLRSLELLKLRFGEDALHECSLMVKDIDDSRRMQQQQSADDGSATTTMTTTRVLTRVVWPEMTKKTFEVPEEIQEYQREFEKRFSTRNKSRSLVWMHQRGFAVLDVDFDNCTKRFERVPLLAATLLTTCFTDELSHEVPVSPEEATKRIRFVDAEECEVSSALRYWTSRGALVETDPGRFVAVRNFDEDARGRGENDDANRRNDEDDDDDDDDPLSSELSAMWTPFEPFIKGMLLNLGRLTLDQIHSNLARFAGALGVVKYDKTPRAARSVFALQGGSRPTRGRGRRVL